MWNKYIELKPYSLLKVNIIIKIQNNKLSVFVYNIHIWITLPPACCIHANWSNDILANIIFLPSPTKTHYSAYFWHHKANHSILAYSKCFKKYEKYDMLGVPNTDFKKFKKKKKEKKKPALLSHFLWTCVLNPIKRTLIKGPKYSNNFRGSYTFKKENDEAHL